VVALFEQLSLRGGFAMKCWYCKQELNPKHIAYYKGERVHPECFKKMKQEDKNNRKQSWLDELLIKIKKTR